MLISVFKSNQKLVNALIVVVAIVLWLPAFFVEINTDLTSTNIKWLDVIISIFLIGFQAIYLNIIVNEYKLIKENSHLTGLMLLVINSCCLLFLNLNQVIISNTFIIIAFHQLLRMYNSRNSYGVLFNSGLLIGLATLIYPQSIVFMILLWITLIYTTTAQWRDFIISGIGLAVPIIYFVSYRFVFADLSEFNFNDYIEPLFNFNWTDITLSIKSLFILLVAVSILSFLSLLTTFSRSVVKVKKMLVIVILMFILGLTTLFLNGFDYLATFIIVSIPLAIIFANFFQNLKKPWMAELFFLCLVGSIILSYFS